jgi:hypothetical protein
MVNWLKDFKIWSYSVGEGWCDTSDECLNPAKFLVGWQSSNPIKHCSLDLIEYQTKVKPDLQETPFETGDKFFMGWFFPVN